MIDVKEFRIGNWVQVNGFPMYVVSIHDDGSICCNFDGNEGDVWEFDKSNPCEPIILTDEILLKCGFEKSLQGVKGMDIYDTYRLGLFQIINHYGIYLFKGIQIKHLHQLQSLYHVLTREELQIKL